VKFRVGIGFDLHPLGTSAKLVLGGVEIPHRKGLVGHSDGDVLCHAVTDAVLGACGMGNIGEMFPDSDPRFRGMSSLHFVEVAASAIRGRGFEISNVDSNILAEQPRLQPHFQAMKGNLAAALGISPDDVHVKAKTMERIGPIGAEEAIAAEAVVLVYAE
jgi:2-C-methyl-D-erythritol 2,4-cyclodiphosphate synthase